MQVEGNCFINASSVAAGDTEGEPGTITFAPVKIGRDCTLGSQTSVGPGTDLPDGGVVKVRVAGWVDARGRGWVALGASVSLQWAAGALCRLTLPLPPPHSLHTPPLPLCSPPRPPPTPNRFWR